MILKKILLPAASIIKFFIFIFFLVNSTSQASYGKSFSNDLGTLSLMYHRFNENKYPSTNIKMEVFKKQIDMIEKNNYEFYNPEIFNLEFDKPKTEKKILLTIDDGFSSFYENAWPYLKNKKIPFILFISTEPVGKHGYMTWNQISEIEKENFAFIGNHSHSHEYLTNYDFKDFKKDIDRSIKIFEDKLGYNPYFFSYPFGEYSLEQKKYIIKKFKYAFGQHSGVIDFNKDKFELPRFPINEKYGELKRFKSILKTLPFPYKKITPEERYLLDEQNPPEVKITFFENQENLKNINCYSNDGNVWKKSNIEFISKYELLILLNEKFKSERGRINCSLWVSEGRWRWLGIQYVIAEYQ